MFAEVDCELRDVQLISWHDERNAVFQEARAVMSAQRLSDENDDGIGVRSYQFNVFGDFGWCCFVVRRNKEYALPSSD